ncbi:hypothetical protein CGC21_5385 [Leishmania donovani]|uniref:Uncharacterized protein n=1 Tax=Leishmania donovani TaxID=5661 RepID=A0A504XZK1_LEIDO|nr:hypothetical protein CGC21_5385 [Leishmania donovani]
MPSSLQPALWCGCGLSGAGGQGLAGAVPKRRIAMLTPGPAHYDADGATDTSTDVTRALDCLTCGWGTVTTEPSHDCTTQSTIHFQEAYDAMPPALTGRGSLPHTTNATFPA